MGQERRAYWAVDASGKLRQGIFRGEDSIEVERHCSRKGWLLVHSERAVPGSSLLSSATQEGTPARIWTWIRSRASRFNVFVQAFSFSSAWKRRFAQQWMRQLAFFLKGGFSLGLAMERIQQIPGQPAFVRHLSLKLHEQVSNGASFTQSLRAQGPFWSRFLIGMIEVGERQGALEAYLSQALDYEAILQETFRKVRASLMYPMIFAGMALLSAILLSVWIVPRFEDFFYQMGMDAEQLPALTRNLLSFSDLVLEHPIALISAAGALCLAIQLALRVPALANSWEQLLSRIPFWRPCAEAFAQARVCFVLGTLLKAGSTLCEALRIASDAEPLMSKRRQLRLIKYCIEEGDSFEDALNQVPILPPIATQILQAGTRSGHLSESLEMLAQTAQEDLSYALKRFSALIEPLLMILMATALGFLIASLFMPILELIHGPGPL